MLTVTTRSIPSRDQPLFWEATLREMYFAMDGASPTPQRGFKARMERMSFGGLIVDKVVAEPYRVVRSSRLAKRAPSDTLLMFVLQRGNVVVSQDARTADLSGRDDFVLVDSAAGYQAELVQPSELTIVQVPRSFLPPHLSRLTEWTGRRVSGQERLVALASSTLLALQRHEVDRDDALAHSAARNAVDLAASAVMEQLYATDKLTSRATMLNLAKQFMINNIADSELSAAAVAAAIPISERYLFSIFRDEGTSPAAWLRHARLERARKLIELGGSYTEPTLQEIACAVGLPRASHFSRLFREQYGLSPRGYRETIGVSSAGRS